MFRDAVNNINPHKIINFTSVEKHYTCKDNGNNNNMQKGNRMTSYDKSFNTPYKHIVHNNNINFGRPPTNIQYFHKQLSSDRNLHIYKLTSLTSLW